MRDSLVSPVVITWCGHGIALSSLRAGRPTFGEYLFSSTKTAGAHTRAGRRRSERMQSLARHRVAHMFAQMFASEAHVCVRSLAPRGLPGGALPRCLGIVLIVSYAHFLLHRLAWVCAVSNCAHVISRVIFESVSVPSSVANVHLFPLLSVTIYYGIPSICDLRSAIGLT